MTIDSLSASSLRRDDMRATCGEVFRRVARILAPRWRPHVLIPMNTGWMVTTPEDALRRWESR